jgi:hypothetical protein
MQYIVWLAHITLDENEMRAYMRTYIQYFSIGLREKIHPVTE